MIVSCERLVSNEEIRSDPTPTTIPFYRVDAVCHVRYGSYPGNMPYEYYSDEDHLRKWLTVEPDKDDHLAFLDRFIFGVDDFSGYVELCGGEDKMQHLRREELSPGAE